MGMQLMEATRISGVKPDRVNMGAGFEISIKDLAELITNLTGFKGKIIWNTVKHAGLPRRMLDTGRAEREFAFRGEANSRRGIKGDD